MSTENEDIIFQQAKKLESRNLFSNDDIHFFKNKKKNIEENKKFERQQELKQITLYRNKNLIKILNDIISDKTKNKILVVRGNIGCGKSTFIEKFLTDKNYQVNVVDKEYSGKEYSDLKKSVISKGIESIFGMTKLKAIIIKNFDQNLKNHQLQDFFKFLLSKNTIPIFLTTTNQNISASRIVPSSVTEYNFENALNSQLNEIARSFIEKQLNDYYIQKVTKESKGDIRFIKNNITQINTEKQKNKKEIKKDISYNITDKLLIFGNKKLKIKEKLRNSNIHTNQVVFENYPIFIRKYKKDSLITLETMSNVADMMTYNDITFQRVFQEQLYDSDLFTASNYIGTVAPISKITKLSENIKQKEIFKTIKFSPNYNSTHIPNFYFYENYSFALVNIVQKNQVQKFIENLYDIYQIDETKLKTIFKFASLNKNMKFKLNLLKKLLSKYIEKLKNEEIETEVTIL